MEMKIEYNSIKLGEPSSIGFMIEANAPKAPEGDQEVIRAAKGIVFVVDRSGSMGGGRLELVKQSMLDMVQRLNRNDYLSIVTFDSVADVVVPMTCVQNLNQAELARKIADIEPRGMTNLEAGYRFALAEATTVPEGIETTVLLLSDGEANSGETTPEKLGQLSAAATEHLITTSTLGIGEGYDEKVLDALSVSGHGNHFAAFRLEEAITGISDELDGLTKKTIGNIAVEISGLGEFENNIQVRKTQYLRNFQTNQNGSIANLGDLVSDEQKNFVFEIKLGAAKTEQIGAKAFTVRIGYDDLTTGKATVIEQEIKLNVFAEENFVVPQKNEDITAELAALRLNDLKEQAIALAEQGRLDEARKLVKDAGAELQHYIENFANLSERNRLRLQRSQVEFDELGNLSDSNEFQKRSSESLNRGRRSKRDPRRDS